MAPHEGEGIDEESLMDAALEAGAEDITDEGGHWAVVTEPHELANVRRTLEAGGFALASAELTMIPKTTIETPEKEARQVLRLVDLLEENDDVQEVHANFDISEDVLEAVAG